jgi:hypothetical protein
MNFGTQIIRNIQQFLKQLDANVRPAATNYPKHLGYICLRHRHILSLAPIYRSVQRPQTLLL